MKVVGIIVEYNPLHNGHEYHINKIKELAKPDLIIAVMSSSITMRGDLSIFDKFTKAKQALQNSVDIVIELPLVYALQRADIFAKNSVDLLNSMGVNEIWIGSEQNNVCIYEEAYINSKDIIIENGESYKMASIKQYPFDSNDILGFGYYKAIKDSGYNIQLNTIKRESSNYLDSTPTDNKIASALAIRENLKLINNYCPSYVFTDIDKYLDENKLFNLIKYKIISSSLSALRDLFFVDEGLENRLKDVINYNSLDEFINFLTTKRYTKTRIKRMLMYILFNISKNEINNIQKEKIPFVRILGYSQNGKSYINSIKKDISIYTNIKEGLHPSLDIELRVSKILDSVYDKNIFNLEQKGPIKKDCV